MARMRERLAELLLFLKQEELNQRSFLAFDLDALLAGFDALKLHFPVETLHAVAVKANPLLGILEHLKEQGAGAECASWGECELALAAGYDPTVIVYDSPVKSEPDLELALRAGITINADSFQEWERIERLLLRIDSSSRLGLRINPQIGESKILMTSVVGKGSKFGVPLQTDYDRLKHLYLSHENLSAIHVHAGSQGCSLEFMVDAVAAVYAFAEDVNQAALAEFGAPRIKTFDIGGGASVVYREGQVPFDMSAYVANLKRACPSLFSSYQLITEFGRYIHAPHATAFSQVEYLKSVAEDDLAMIHFGADLLIRDCYAPDNWSHEMSVYDQKGRLKVGETRSYTVAGPLCFSGDIITRHRHLPKIDCYDYLAIHDVGAYSFSMWSVYNSRPFPLCVGYRSGQFSILRREDSPQDIISFWSRR